MVYLFREWLQVDMKSSVIFKKEIVMGMRIERDSMGPVEIPAGKLWGAQTQRAIENFPISGITFHPEFISALAGIKLAAAQANVDLGVIPFETGRLIIAACEEVIRGGLADQFPLDIFQTGSGTSTNMNMNEVLANWAIRHAGGAIGTKTPVHPNDHVNASQSSNDVIPTAIHIAAVRLLTHRLVPALRQLTASLESKAIEFDDIVKTGRTHLQDATPIRLGQEFSGYAHQMTRAILRAESAAQTLRELPLGGTAVGSGINRHNDFPAVAIRYLNALDSERYFEAVNHFEANAARDSAVEASGMLRTIAVSLSKLSNDIRWLGSGPRNGLGELRLPPVQPGSSIMPGKVNPVIPESVLMVCAWVISSDLSVTLAGLNSVFELNMMMPLIAHQLIGSIRYLAQAVDGLRTRCIDGLSADSDHIREMVGRGLALATALAPVIGYDRAAEISKTAHASGRTIREIVEEQGLIPADQIDAVLDLRKMTEPGIFSAGE